MDKAEVLLEELMNIWEQPENYTKADILEVFEHAGELIKEYGHQLGQESLELLRDWRIQNMICPDCGETLTYKSHKEESEAWGRIVTENIGTLVCEGCGWTENE